MAVIMYMSVNPDFRSAINIRADERIVDVCKSLFSVSSDDRTKEPKKIKKGRVNCGVGNPCCVLKESLKAMSFITEGILARSQ